MFQGLKRTVAAALLLGIVKPSFLLCILWLVVLWGLIDYSYRPDPFAPAKLGWCVLKVGMAEF